MEGSQIKYEAKSNRHGAWYVDICTSFYFFKLEKVAKSVVYILYYKFPHGLYD